MASPLFTQGRAAVSLLIVSASLLVGVATREGYTDKAIIPVPGDVPTIDFGRTKGVKMGDKSNPIRGLQYLEKELDEFAAGINKCIKVPLYQHEFEAFLSLAYNVGVGAVCQTADKNRKPFPEPDRMMDVLNKGNYAEACRRILSFNKMGGKVLKGLTIRRQEEYKQCIGEG